MARSKANAEQGKAQEKPKTNTAAKKEKVLKHDTKNRVDPFKDLTAEQAKELESRFFEVTDQAPHAKGVIVNVDGLDADPRSIEVKYTDGKTWDEKTSILPEDKFIWVVMI